MRLPASSGVETRSSARGRGRGATTSRGRGRGTKGATPSSICSVTQPLPSVDPTPDEFDPELQYNERGRGRGAEATTSRLGRGQGTSGATPFSVSSVPQPVPSVNPTPDEFDPELEDNEIGNGPDDLWERGPTRLPDIPTREDDKILLTPEGDTQWGEENEGGRLPNGILGVLIREAFPGIVKYKGRDEPAWHWQQYDFAEDTSEEGTMRFDSALQRVEERFWLWFKWPNGKEHAARRVVRNVVKKLIPQMFYEGRIQSVIIYHNHVLGKKIKRAQACQTYLTKEEYMQAIPWWAQKAPEAWALAADLKWCNETWKEKSRAAKERRQRMGGATHRQGNCSHARWKKKMEKVKKRQVSDVEAYTVGRMGDQEGTFCNPKAAANIDAYTEAAKELHGPDFDVMNAPLDKVAVYRAGRGKKHGRYLIGDGFINTPSTLPEVRSLVNGSENEVRPQRSQQTSGRDRLYEQEVEARKILEEKFDNQVEITKCLKEGYSALALIIQTHLNVPVPPLVLPSQTTSHQGTGESGGSNIGAAGTEEAGEGEHADNESHVEDSVPIH